MTRPVYLYSKTTGLYFISTDYVVINEDDINQLNLEYENDIKASYGAIAINAETYKPYFRYNDAFIRIMKNTNDFEKVDKIFDENQYMYYAVVKQKEFIEMDAKRRTGNIVKYFDGKFHIFDNKPEYDYKPETNKMIFNFDSYRQMVASKVLAADVEIRDHGYYYSLWEGITYVQPFRRLGASDYQFIDSVFNLPTSLRELYLFIEDENKKRLESKYVLRGKDVSDYLLSMTRLLIIAYDSKLKTAINDVVTTIQETTALDTLKYFEYNYVTIILNSLRQMIESAPEFKTGMADLKKHFEANGIEAPTEFIDAGDMKK